MPDPIPVTLQRRIVPKPWGGQELVGHLDLDPDSVGSEPIGETWEVYDRPDGSSLLRDGTGRTLRDLLEESGDAVLGRGVKPAPGGRFPLLLKYLDARERLSVQVHPGAEQAAEMGDGPKSEAWLVLDAEPAAGIHCGLADGVTRDLFETAFDTPGLEPLLKHYRPVAGDVFTLPSGTVHALGPGVVVFEIQENSDLTFRVYDWGRGRQLHLDEARVAIRDPLPDAGLVVPERIDAQSSWLVRTDAFRVRRFQCIQPATLGSEGSFKLLTVLDGFGTLGWRSGGEHPPLRLKKGETTLVPACVDSVFVSPIGALDLLWSDPGEVR